mgnify:CR=1 FL=1
MPKSGKTWLALELAFAVASGTMVASGLGLWFATQAMAVMPKWLFDLLAVLHGRESVVIFLLLFLWHLYDVHLRPEVFPMDWSWITGRISRSVKLCGCGEQRSPEMELIASTQSEPIS